MMGVKDRDLMLISIIKCMGFLMSILIFKGKGELLLHLIGIHLGDRIIIIG
jgi:hypothetical protein